MLSKCGFFAFLLLITGLLSSCGVGEVEKSPFLAAINTGDGKADITDIYQIGRKSASVDIEDITLLTPHLKDTLPAGRHLVSGTLRRNYHSDIAGCGSDVPFGPEGICRFADARIYISPSDIEKWENWRKTPFSILQ